MIDTNTILLTALVPIVLTVVISLAVIVFVVIILRKVGAMSAPNRELLATGESAQATIVNLWDTGTSVNDNPLVGLLLEVRPASRPPYQVKTSLLISRLQIPQYQPGRVLAVKFDPTNPEKVAIAGVLSQAAA